MDDKDLTRRIIGAAIEVHRQLGPGLLESAYERQKAVAVIYKGAKLECGYRTDLLVENRVVVELKAIEQIAPIHEAVVLTYLKLSNKNVGLLVNFHVPVLKDGIRRYLWREKKEFTTEATEVHEDSGEDAAKIYA